MSPYAAQEKKQKHGQEYYAKNKDKIKKKNILYYNKNRDRYIKQRTKLREDNREEYNKRARESYRKLRLQVLKAFGGRCQCCGESELLFLELDHIKNDGYKRKDKSAQTLYRNAKKEGYPINIYQLLCANCNQGKRRNGGICPHKTS